jgi:hypothetical protein
VQGATVKLDLFLRSFLKWSLGLAGTIWLAILLLDPFGVSPLRLPGAHAIMDINQRYMYPQIVRSGRYDSVVIGTSTSRLLDPKELDAAFGGRFANLAMNAGTAWEQTEMAKLFLRHQPAPKSFILGLDQMWCLDAASIKRITERGFPEWMYDENRWNDLPHLFSLQTLEIAGRLLAFKLGLMPARIRADGYEVFTPPENSYDLARAQFHIWKGRLGMRIVPEVPPAELNAAARRALIFPALAWMDDLLAQVPPSTLRVLALMPLHVAAQATPGSLGEASMNECKARIAAIGAKHGVQVVDFSIASDITRTDANYWDPLHYRVPIASRIVAALKQAQDTRRDDSAGFFVLK